MKTTIMHFIDHDIWIDKSGTWPCGLPHTRHSGSGDWKDVTCKNCLRTKRYKNQRKEQKMKNLVLLIIILLCSSSCFAKSYEVPEKWKYDHFLNLTRQDLNMDLEENYLLNQFSIDVMVNSHRNVMHSLERGHWRKMTMAHRWYGRPRCYRSYHRRRY